MREILYREQKVEHEQVKAYVIVLGAYTFIVGGMLMVAFPEIQEKLSLWLLHFL